MKYQSEIQIIDDADFLQKTLSVFRLQYSENKIYREYCDLLKFNIDKISTLEEIPFLPILFFKTHKVKTGNFEPELFFRSSGTTNMSFSTHYIKDKVLYDKILLECFRYFYGDPQDYTFLALLPNYLEQSHSSLVYMMTQLMAYSASKQSGFYLYNHQQLYDTLIALKEQKAKTILFGVSFALLDFVEKYSIDFPELIVFETGGMKGRRKEMLKEELHVILKQAFHVSHIHSEYGMCELLSQAYSQGNNIFHTPPWMKLLLRDEKDPLNVSTQADYGGVNVIDLANIWSCAFIATEDLGKRATSGIEIIGRMDDTEMRGCNLMVL